MPTEFTRMVGTAQTRFTYDFDGSMHYLECPTLRIKVAKPSKNAAYAAFDAEIRRYGGQSVPTPPGRRR